MAHRHTLVEMMCCVDVITVHVPCDEPVSALCLKNSPLFRVIFGILLLATIPLVFIEGYLPTFFKVKQGKSAMSVVVEVLLSSLLKYFQFLEGCIE
ncbi:hypothetical protein XBJ1_1930 [Xenorhabdus bovienii SS-2004]|uniref:Uncharacterized protein n=1 Tax=Xenorhabdus bovienii (strain SS-2004) TaxID=406818 RepID=D3V2U1_XENBS|nr:hypothetical protein [Xenorhabdus bovienii]CBJ81056.1 hypothetical protein XBJ1_1930 [Xenorhabdus bovienii SS-2004]